MTPVGRVIGGVRSVCVEDYTLTAVAIGYCTLPYSPLPEKEGDKKVSVEVGGSCVVVSPHIPDIPLVISISTKNILLVVVVFLCSAWSY